MWVSLLKFGIDFYGDSECLDLDLKTLDFYLVEMYFNQKTFDDDPLLRN